MLKRFVVLCLTVFFLSGHVPVLSQALPSPDHQSFRGKDNDSDNNKDDDREDDKDEDEDENKDDEDNKDSDQDKDDEDTSSAEDKDENEDKDEDNNSSEDDSDKDEDSDKEDDGSQDEDSDKEDDKNKDDSSNDDDKQDEDKDDDKKGDDKDEDEDNKENEDKDEDKGQDEDEYDEDKDEDLQYYVGTVSANDGRNVIVDGSSLKGTSPWLSILHPGMLLEVYGKWEDGSFLARDIKVLMPSNFMYYRGPGTLFAQPSARIEGWTNQKKQLESVRSLPEQGNAITLIAYHDGKTLLATPDVFPLPEGLALGWVELSGRLEGETIIWESHKPFP